MIVAATGRGLAGVWFEGQRHLPDCSAGPWSRTIPCCAKRCCSSMNTSPARARGFDLPLDLQGGTAFQQSVWQALLAIPPGGTTSYGALSRRVGRPLRCARSARRWAAIRSASSCPATACWARRLAHRLCRRAGTQGRVAAARRRALSMLNAAPARVDRLHPRWRRSGARPSCSCGWAPWSSAPCPRRPCAWPWRRCSCCRCCCCAAWPRSCAGTGSRCS